ncbi:MAG: recombinase family protein [Oscillospiraceae bacterium]
MMKTNKPEEKDTRKVAIYARKSKVTESGKSVENQITKCRSYADLKFDAQEQDILVYQDEGLSGYYSDRPQYMQLLRDISDNKIKAVICYKFDRISRKTLDLLNLVEQLKIKKIAFISCTDEVDTSSRTGKIVMSLLASIAEFERDIIAERIADNMYELAKEGRWLGGTTPLGFWSKKEHLNIGGRKTTINHLEPVEEEQVVVKEMFRVFLEQRSLGKVVEWAESKKLVTRLGKAHTRISVKNILQNPVYAMADTDIYEYFRAFNVPIYAEQSEFDSIHGLMIYNKTEQVKEQREDSTAIHPEYVQRSSRREVCDWIISTGQHKGIVSGREWIRTQSVLEKNRDKFKRPNEETHSLLAGIIVCPICGKNMHTYRESGRYTADGKSRFSYKCQTHRADKDACPCADVKGNFIDQFVFDAICSMSEPDNDYYEQLTNNQAALRTHENDAETEMKQILHNMEKIQRELEGQTKTLRLAPETAKPILLADLERLLAEQQECELRKTELIAQKNSNTQTMLSIEKAKELIFSFPRLLEALSYKGCMEIIHQIIIKVFVVKNTEGDDEVHIFLKGTPEGEYEDFFRETPDSPPLYARGKDSILYAT